MKRKWIYIILAIIIIVFFFYPKECGNWGTALEALYQDCNCLGIKTTEPVGGGAPYYCLGICLGCECVQYDLTDISKGLVPCKTGIECSSSARSPLVSLDIVKNNVPSNLSEIVTGGVATPCIDYDIIKLGPRVTCLACGWICAVDSPYFWRFTYNNEELDVHIWDVQCMGTGLEYRLKGQEAKKGYKVTIER